MSVYKKVFILYGYIVYSNGVNQFHIDKPRKQFSNPQLLGKKKSHNEYEPFYTSASALWDKFSEVQFLDHIAHAFILLLLLRYCKLPSLGPVPCHTLQCQDYLFSYITTRGHLDDWGWLAGRMPRKERWLTPVTSRSPVRPWTLSTAWLAGSFD